MGFLDSLSQGLRGAGAVLNPQVEGQIGAEHQQMLRQKQTMQTLVAQRVIGGIENGSIDPEQGQQALAQLGVQLPPGAIGASPEAEARKTAAANEAKFREEIAALGPGATQEQLAQVAAKYSRPDAILNSQTASMDRRAKMEADIQARKDKLEADLRAAADRKATAVEMERIRQEGRADMIRLAASLRQGPAPQTITNADGVFRVGADNVAVPVVGQDGKPISGKTTADRVIPAPIVRAYNENNNAIRKIDDALDALSKNPGAIGLDKAMVGDEIAQRMDPKGVVTRALINDIGSLKIHDRSGAAVTAAEFPRLKPFIPKTSDTASAAEKKLKLFRKEYKAIQDDFNGTYNAEQGYKPFPNAGGTSAAPPPPGFKVD